MNNILKKQRRVVELVENAIKATEDELHSLRNSAQTTPDLRSLVQKYEARLERQRDRLHLSKRELAALEAIANTGGKPKRGA